MRVSFLAAGAIDVLGGYLLFYAGTLDTSRLLSWFRDIPDISYGVYVYGWAIECFFVSRFGARPVLVCACSIPVSFTLGWLSWHFVEEPMLRLKKRSPRALPTLVEAEAA